MKTDLFEAVQKRIGCAYISDLRAEKHADAAKAALCKMNLSKYRITELRDMAKYLYGEQVPSDKKAQLIAFLKGDAG